jgi:hypothetical protein
VVSRLDAERRVRQRHARSAAHGGCSLTAGLYRIHVTLDAVDERTALERTRELVDVAARRARRPVHPDVTADVRRVSD